MQNNPQPTTVCGQADPISRPLPVRIGVVMVLACLSLCSCRTFSRAAPVALSAPKVSSVALAADAREQTGDDGNPFGDDASADETR